MLISQYIRNFNNGAVLCVKYMLIKQRTTDVIIDVSNDVTTELRQSKAGRPIKVSLILEYGVGLLWMNVETCASLLGYRRG